MRYISLVNCRCRIGRAEYWVYSLAVVIPLVLFAVRDIAGILGFVISMVARAIPVTAELLAIRPEEDRPS